MSQIRRDRREAGFTLIEIIMVVVIIGLVAGVALPRLNVNQYRVNAGVRTVASLLTQAQRRAVTQQYNVNVIFVATANALKIHEDDDNDNVQDPNERVRQYPIGENVVYGQGGAPDRPNGSGPVTFTRQQGGLPLLIFRRDGSASENGTIYMTSINAQTAGRIKDARAVEVILATGRISWYQYSGSAWIKRF